MKQIQHRFIFLMLGLLFFQFRLSAQEQEPVVFDPNEYVFFRYMPDKAAVQVGEAMKINMEVCTRINISEIELVEFPNCDKLSTIILDAAFSEVVHEESLDEKLYSCKALMAKECYPMEPGNLNLTHFSCRIKLLGKSYDLKSKELNISVLENNKASSGYLASDIDKLVCRRLYDSLIKEGIVRYEVEIIGKGCPGLFKLDSTSFDKRAELSVELADIDVGKNFKSNHNKRRLTYTLRFKEAGNYTFHPSCRFWDSQNRMIREISDSVQLINIEQEPLINTIEKQVKPENDIIFLVDLSSSMLFQDYNPNRLAFIKNNLKTAVSEKNISDRVSIIGFTAENLLLCPPSTDLKTVNNTIDSLSIGKMPEGTNLGNPILKALQMLYSSPAKQKTIVVFSDFVLNSSSVYKIEWLAQVAAAIDVSIVSIVVGTNGKTRGPIARKPDGTLLYGTLDSETDDLAAAEISDYTRGAVYKTTTTKQISLKQMFSRSAPRRTAVEVKPYLLEALFGN